MTRFIRILFEKFAFRLGIPIGGVFLAVIFGGGLIYIIAEHPLPKSDLILGVIMWTASYGFLWFCYGAEFWMDIGLLKQLREAENELFDENNY
jgi:hypothetical protein